MLAGLFFLISEVRENSRFHESERRESASVLASENREDDRVRRQERLANLQFVRDLATSGRRAKPFGGLDLEDQILAGLDLSDADLRGANLTNAVLNSEAIAVLRSGDAEIEALDQRAVSLEAQINRASSSIEEEIAGENGRSGCGPSCAALLAERVALNDELDETRARRAALVNEIASQTAIAGAPTVLVRALLGQANLTNVDFSNTDLSEADLTGTDVSGAVFTQSDLRGVTLTDACWLENNEPRWPLDYEPPPSAHWCRTGGPVCTGRTTPCDKNGRPLPVGLL